MRYPEHVLANGEKVLASRPVASKVPWRARLFLSGEGLDKLLVALDAGEEFLCIVSVQSLPPQSASSEMVGRAAKELVLRAVLADATCA
jgi:hypothetical protein